jgi:hypothetical protein
MKTFGDLQQKVKDTSKEELERIVLDIAEVWLIERGATADSLLDSDTPLDSESLGQVTSILSSHGLWPDHN